MRVYFKKLLSIASVIFILVAFGSITVAATQEVHEVSIGESSLNNGECFMLLAGKDATVDGSVLLAHNNDLDGNNASLIEKIPRQKHDPNEVVRFPSGLVIPQVEETYEWIVLKIYKGFAEGDAIAINEHQVCIAGGVALGADLNDKAKEADPLVKEGLTGGVRYVALERSKTARECVELIGNLYSKYGITYPSGVGVADPNEVWYIEPGGGHTWVAVRIPDNCYFAQANALRIGEIDLTDTENVITSENLLEHAKEHGLWNPEDGKFNFAKVFGGKKLENPATKYYDSRRVWDVMNILSPSLKLDPYETEYPMFAVPVEKLSIQKLISRDVLRSHYDDTIFDVHPPKGPGSGERAVAVQNCVHTDVIQLRGWMPADIGAVLWAGLSAPLTTAYIPYYFGINDVPIPYKIAGPEYDEDSAFWAFRTLASLVSPWHPILIDEILPVFEELETNALKLQNCVEETALKLYTEDKELAKQFLTYYSNGLSLKALDIAWDLVDQMRAKIAELSYKW